MRVNLISIFKRQSDLTVQAGTPMTVTGNGTSFLKGDGVFPIFCQKISSGVWGQTAPSLAAEAVVAAHA